jgi:hypothetical protein
MHGYMNGKLIYTHHPFYHYETEACLHIVCVSHYSVNKDCVIEQR